MKQIFIYLRRDRNVEGVLFFEPMPNGRKHRACYGKADSKRALEEGNPTRDPTLPYGDAPSGWFVPTVVTRWEPPHRRMGKYSIPLVGAYGEARIAKERGRVGLAIHGGPRDSEGRLRATYGCIRVDDATMEELVEWIGSDKVEVCVVDT